MTLTSKKRRLKPEQHKFKILISKRAYEVHPVIFLFGCSMIEKGPGEAY